MDHRFLDSRSAFRCKPSALWIRFDHPITIKGPLVSTRYKSSRYSNVNSAQSYHCPPLVDARICGRRYSDLWSADARTASGLFQIIRTVQVPVHSGCSCISVVHQNVVWHTNDVRFKSPASSIFFFWSFNLVATHNFLFCLCAPGPGFSVDNLS